MIVATREILHPSSILFRNRKSVRDNGSSKKKKKVRKKSARNINFSSIPYFLSQRGRGEKQPSSFRGGVYLGGGARFTKEAAWQEKRGGGREGAQRGWLDRWATSYDDKLARLLADVRAICARVGRDNAEPIDRFSCIYVVLSHLFERYTRVLLFSFFFARVSCMHLSAEIENLNERFDFRYWRSEERLEV